MNKYQIIITRLLELQNKFKKMINYLQNYVNKQNNHNKNKII